jgi:hypothetical protein
LQPLAFVHVGVLAIDQFPAAHVLPAPEAYDDRFHTTNLYGINPIIALIVATAK